MLKNIVAHCQRVTVRRGILLPIIIALIVSIKIKAPFNLFANTNAMSLEQPATRIGAASHIFGRQLGLAGDVGKNTSFNEDSDGESRSDLGEQAFELAQSIFKDADLVQYKHSHSPADQQVIKEQDGHFDVRTDCSGWISYLVQSIAPRHYQLVASMQPKASYPKAKTWAQFFASLNSQEPANGWQRITDFRELRRGDIIAWVKGKGAVDHAGHGNTGHIMMVADPPQAEQQEVLGSEKIRYVSVRVIDSSSVYHFPPEELPPHAKQEHRNGLGIGYIRILLSDSDEPIGYWEGTYWGQGDKPIKSPKHSTVVCFGRMVPIAER